MKKLLLFFCFLCFSYQTEAGELIAVLVCDTEASNIEDASAADLESMRREASRICQHTGLSLREVVFSENLRPKPFYRTLKALSVTDEDVVLFYFSGHGYRTPSKENPWPNLFFSASKSGVDFFEVTRRLEQKRPRLLISIADCCNNILPTHYAAPVYHGSLFAKAPSRVVLNYQQLFLEQTGTVIVASSEVGEYSWCISKGALFTLAFVESLQIETKKRAGEADWQTLLDRAAYTVRARQHPLYLIQP